VSKYIFQNIVYEGGNFFVKCFVFWFEKSVSEEPYIKNLFE